MRLGLKNQASTNSATRAEELRRRRSEQSKKRVSKASQMASHPVRVRPVLMRGSGFGTPIHRKARTTPRRAFYLTVDRAAGVELRLPSLPMIRPGWRLLSGLIAIAALVGIYSFWNSFFFRVGGVDVVGLERISAEEINDRLRLDGYSIIEIDPAAVVQQVREAYPDLRSVQVAVELPNYVTLHAVERQPVMAWQQGDQIHWLDEEGVVFPARGDAGPLVTIHAQDALPLVPLLPVTSGDGDEAETDADAPISVEPRRVDITLLEAVQGLSQKLPPETQIAYDGQSGLGWIDASGTHVYIGTDLTNFEEKYLMYQQLASHLAARGEVPYMISVEHLDAPFYRLEP